MDTNQLIRTLAADNTHRARPVGFALMLALLAASPVSLLMFFTELGVRPDVMVAMRNPFFDLKFAVTLALAIAAIAVSLHLSRPEASLRGFRLAAAGAGGDFDRGDRRRDDDAAAAADDDAAGGQELVDLPDGDPGAVAADLAGALIGLRHGAPARPATAGAIAGLLSAGLAATLYASHCTDDSPLFVAAWYTIATALVTAIGALAGAKLLRY